MGEAIEGGFDRGHGRARQNLLWRRFGGRRLERGRRGAALATASVNSRSSAGSTVMKVGVGGSGSAISSVSSSTSPSGKAGRISSAVVASSRPFSKASMSSWLLDAAGSGAAGGGAGGGALAAAACAAGIADGGMSFITAASRAAPRRLVFPAWLLAQGWSASRRSPALLRRPQ